MIRARRPVVARRRLAGLSLIEMMIALIMALIVAAGIITVFQSTSSSNQVQNQLSTLQEEGRFAIHSLRGDLANANGGYCSNTGGNAMQAPGGVLPLDALRSPTVYSKDNTALKLAFSDDTTPMLAPTQAFSLPSFMYMRGYDCTTTACTPTDPNTLVSTIPPMGKAVNDRVLGASLLTVRYLKPGSGWAIVSPGTSLGSTIQPNNDGTVDTITLDTLTGEPDPGDFANGDLAMLADCSNAQVFSVSASSGLLTLTGANFAQPLDITKGAAPRVFDFSKDFQTITYYLRVVDAGNGHTTGELVRRINGGVAQSLVRGVERMDFRYGIIGADGKTQFLLANEVDTGVDSSGNNITCPPGVSVPGGMPDDAAHGCLWRAVKTIEVHILMDGQAPLYSMAPKEMEYIYTPDSDAMAAPSLHAIKPNVDQGFPKQLLRREFTTLVALRNFNP